MQCCLSYLLRKEWAPRSLCDLGDMVMKSSEIKAIVVYCTVPDTATGRKIAKVAVEEGLCACVNQLPGITSYYVCNSKLCEDAEELLIIKTRASHFEALKERITELHPYEIPEIVAMPVTNGSEAYMQWLGKALKPL